MATFNLLLFNSGDKTKIAHIEWMADGLCRVLMKVVKAEEVPCA